MVDMADKARVLLRGLLREFRHLGDGQLKRNIRFSWRNVPAYNQVREDFNLMKDCTNKDDIDDCILNCELYLSYLHAVRREKELEEKYKSVGERPLEEIAAKVGLKLPEIYQDRRDS